MAEVSKDLPRTKEELSKYDLTSIGEEGKSYIKAAVAAQIKEPTLEIWKHLADGDYKSRPWWAFYDRLQKKTGYNPSGSQLQSLKNYMKLVAVTGLSKYRVKTSSSRKTPKVDHRVLEMIYGPRPSSSIPDPTNPTHWGGRKSGKSKHLRMKLKRTRSKKIKKCTRRSRRS